MCLSYLQKKKGLQEMTVICQEKNALSSLEQIKGGKLLF